MVTFDIDLGSVKYPIYVGSGIAVNLESTLNKICPLKNFVVIADISIVALNCELFKRLNRNGAYRVYHVLGEKNNKSLYAAMKIFEYLEEYNIPRDITIIAIGGGVVGDLAGFVASCWYRGVDLIHIPTTLLSAVDSCLGGKTAVNFRNTVNAVGTYHHPKAILIDLELLKMLPNRELSSGFGEIIKYACIGSHDIKDLLNKGSIYDLKYLQQLIEMSLKAKEKLVYHDINESSKRLFLNFGHTIGHAIEFSTLYNGKESLRHGEGVALGMVAIYKICIELGYLKESDLISLKQILLKYDLPVNFKSSLLQASRKSLIDRIVDLSFKDKKRTASKLRLVLIDEKNQPFMFMTSDRNLIRIGVEEIVI